MEAQPSIARDALGALEVSLTLPRAVRISLLADFDVCRLLPATTDASRARIDHGDLQLGLRALHLESSTRLELFLRRMALLTTGRDRDARKRCSHRNQAKHEPPDHSNSFRNAVLFFGK